MAVTGCPSHGVFTFPPEVQPRNPFSGWAGSGQGIHQPIGCLGAPETLVARDLESTGPATCPPVLAPAGPSTAAPAIVLTLNHRPCLPRPRWESWLFLPSCLQSQARGLTPSQRFGHPTGRPQVSPLHNAGPSECAQAHCRLAHSTHAGFWSPSACEALQRWRTMKALVLETGHPAPSKQASRPLVPGLALPAAGPQPHGFPGVRGTCGRTSPWLRGPSGRTQVRLMTWGLHGVTVQPAGASVPAHVPGPLGKCTTAGNLTPPHVPLSVPHLRWHPWPCARRLKILLPLPQAHMLPIPPTALENSAS